MFPVNRVNGAKRFIHKHDGRVSGHSPGNTDPLLLTAGKLFWVSVPVLVRVKIDDFKKLLHFFINFCLIPF